MLGLLCGKPKLHMHKNLQKAIDRLETQRQKILSDTGQLSEERLRFRPDASTWSILDILDHLVKVESATLKMVRDNQADGHPIALKDRLGALMVTTVMKTNIRVKVPQQATMVLPTDVAGTAEIFDRWNNLRVSMAALLGELEGRQLRVGLFRHPIGGWMNMAQTLGFLSAHLQHHVHQINRVKALAASKI